MNAFQRWLPLALLSLASAALADPAPDARPAAADRLTRTVNGIRFQYSPGQDALVEAVAARASVWNRDIAAREAQWNAALDRTPALFSARDLRAHRDEILQQVATAMGLDAPTPLQVAVFNRMFKNYEDLEGAMEKFTEAAWHLADIRDVTVWEKPELAKRLKAGEKIPYFSWDEKTQTVVFNFSPPLSAGPEEAVKKADAKVQQNLLDSSFNYTLKDGVIDIGAGFSVKPGGSAQIKAEPLPPRLPYKLLEPISPIMFPVVRRETELQQPLDQFADGAVKHAQGVLDMAAGVFHPVNLVVVHTLLHEVTEAGLVDRYIGSPDRRWFCEGVSNYVAWKVIRDRAGIEVAGRAYNLPAQLESYAKLQRKVRLSRWTAAENENKKDKGTPLSKAHYAFATRAVMMMAEANGDTVVADVLREVGRTPRSKVTMKSVAVAYQKITGRKLDDLIRAAEKQPVPSERPKPRS